MGINFLLQPSHSVISNGFYTILSLSPVESQSISYLCDIWSCDPGKLYGDHHIKFDQNSLVVHNDEMRESLTQMRPTDFNKTLF